MLSLRGFGDEEITTLSMNNYFSIKISNKLYRNLTKFMPTCNMKTTTVSLPNFFTKFANYYF